MKYKAIVADIDGTVVPVKIDALPSQKVLVAVQKAVDKGIIFTLATGRPFGLVEYLVDHLKLDSPIIVDNGATIYNSESKEVIHDTFIPTQQANDILKMVRTYKKSYNVSCKSENLDSPENLPSHLEVRKFVVHGLKPKEAENLIDELNKSHKNLHVSKTSANEGVEYFSVYISHATATKQYAIAKLAEIIGIQTQEIIAVGDHYNDFPLFMACGLKIAMGNAVDDLKAIADYVAPSVEEDGLAWVIEKFILSD